MAIPKNYPDTSTPLTAEFLLNYCHPVGEVFYTEDDTFDPNVEWGGTWKLDEDGVVYASKSSTNESPFNVDVGTIIGEDTHTLTISEMPSHNHNFNKSMVAAMTTLNGVNDVQQIGGQRIYEYVTINNTGGDQPHNNIQRTKICNIWIRIA